MRDKFVHMSQRIDPFLGVQAFRFRVDQGLPMSAAVTSWVEESS